MATRMDLKRDVYLLAWKRGWDLKYMKTIVNDNRIIHLTHNDLSDLKTYLVSN